MELMDRTELTVTARAGRELADDVEGDLRRCLDALADDGEPLPAEIGLVLVGDKLMTDLHARYSGEASPTDVLTFEVGHDDAGRCVAGEVVVCVPQAKRTCRGRGTPVRHELLLYALHGVLHLCGYDDRERGDFDAMHAKEDDVLTRVGVGPVFSAGDGVGEVAA